MQGLAPGRARTASQRSGSFESGHEKRGGRRRGTPNVFTIDYRKAILEAADAVGFDGNGKHGIFGYFVWIAQDHPEVYVRALLRHVPLVEVPEERRRRAEEINQEIRNYYCLTGTGAGELVDIAVEHPKEFCQLLADAFLRMTAKERRAAARRCSS